MVMMMDLKNSGTPWPSVYMANTNGAIMNKARARNTTLAMNSMGFKLTMKQGSVCVYKKNGLGWKSFSTSGMNFLSTKNITT